MVSPANKPAGEWGMSKAFWAALSGVGAGAMLIGAYIGARRFGVQVPIELVGVGAARERVLA